MKYSMVIQWSEEDRAYVVTFPEWEAVGHIGHVHGATYVEAAEQGTELLANLEQWAQDDGSPLPAPQTFDSTVRA